MTEINNKDLKKLQMVELDMLKEFDRICRKYNITYSLDGGSLIGAVRHNGFIPWDDDIDISMSRNDYNKFLKVQKKELNKKKYYVDSMETNDNNYTLCAKMKRKNSTYSDITSNRPMDEQNIWIDIFPYDNIKSNNFISRLYYLRVYVLKIIMMYKNDYIKFSNDKKKNKFMKYIKFLSRFYNSNRLKKRIIKYMNKYNDKDTKYVAFFAGVYLNKEIMKKEWLSCGVKECTFEDMNAYITKNYDGLLTHLYGDYMKLPPEDKRKGHHYTDCLKFPKD